MFHQKAFKVIINKNLPNINGGYLEKNLRKFKVIMTILDSIFSRMVTFMTLMATTLTSKGMINQEGTTMTTTSMFQEKSIQMNTTEGMYIQFSILVLL